MLMAVCNKSQGQRWKVRENKGQRSCYFIINLILKSPTQKSLGMRLILSCGVNSDRQRKEEEDLKTFDLRADFSQSFTFHLCVQGREEQLRPFDFSELPLTFSQIILLTWNQDTIYGSWSIYTGGGSLHLLTIVPMLHYSLEHLHWRGFTRSPYYSANASLFPRASTLEGFHSISLL